MAKLIQDHHYKYDEITRIITFDKNHSTYKNEKIFFALLDIDIDEIETVNEYDKLRLEYRHELMANFELKWQKVVPKTLEEKYRKSLMLSDIEGVKRLKQIINKKNALHIKVIK